MRSPRTWGAAGLALAAVAMGLALRTSPSASATPCPASLVHYGPQQTATPSLRGLPWILARSPSARVVGYLSYYGGAILSDGRVNGQDGAVIYSGGRADGTATKIVWTRTGTPARALVVSGRQLDGTGTFTIRVPRTRVDGKAAFVATVVVPGAGCWRLGLRGGTLRTSVVVAAVEPPAAAGCDTTPVHPPRDEPNGPLPRQPWVTARPAAAGLSAFLFYPPPKPIETGLSIYTGGRAPNGGTTKILWSARRSGRALAIAGRRLDAAGSFRQTVPPANGSVFPSIPDVPAAGCWLFTVHTGSTAAIVVAEALD